MDSFAAQLHLLVADRHTPEARALFEILLRYVERRVRTATRTYWSDLIADAERDEVVAEVLLQLMTGGLARFRGDSLPSLLAYVRVITDRSTWRLARRRIAERSALEGVAADDVREWTHSEAPPEGVFELDVDAPLPDADKAYLEELLHAGSKAELARRRGVSRAAVTLRVQRIRDRIDALRPADQLAVDAWLHHAARRALGPDPI